MKERSRRSWLILALVSYSLAATLAFGLKSLQSNATAQPQSAAMQLQAAPDAHEDMAAPDADEGKTVACTQRECLPPKLELAIVLDEETRPHESKAFLAPGEDVRPKSGD